MRAHYMLLIFTFLSFGVLSCTSQAQNTNNSSSRPQTDTDDRSSLLKEFFPKIPEATTTRAFPIIASYGKKQGLKPLAVNHMRFFVQPKGYVSQAIDVNLISGDFIKYPGTHEDNQPQMNTIDSKGLKELQDLFTSKHFLGIPSKNRKFGMDGSSLVIEVDFKDSYKWICHWSADDENLLYSVSKLSEIVEASWIYSYIQQKGEGAVQTNHVRLFQPEGLENAYMITDIDLATGKLVERRQGTLKNRTLNKEQVNQLKQELISDEFHKTTNSFRISRGGRRTGSSASMIEYDIDGIYFRKMGGSHVFGDKNDPFNKVTLLIYDFIYNQ